MTRHWIPRIIICLAFIASFHALLGNLANLQLVRAVSAHFYQPMNVPNDYCTLSSEFEKVLQNDCETRGPCRWKVLLGDHPLSTVSRESEPGSDLLTNYFEGWRTWCSGSIGDAIVTWAGFGSIVGERFSHSGRQFLYSDKDPTVALEWLQIAAVLRSNDADVFTALGDAYSQTSKMQEALSAYHRSIQLDGTQSEPYVGAAVAEYALGQYEAAEQHIKKAIDLSPDISTYWQIYGGLLLNFRNNAVQAEPWFRKVVTADPNNDQAYAALAIALVRQEKLSEAYDALQSAVRLTAQPRQKAIYFGAYANALTTINHMQDVAGYYVLALQNDPANTDYAVALAIVYARLGQCTQAEATAEAYQLQQRVGDVQLRAVAECVPSTH